jgi:hypothetical protein
MVRSYEKILGHPNGSPIILSLKVCAPAITTRLYCKMDPDNVRLLLNQQFIEIFVVQVADVE